MRYLKSYKLFESVSADIKADIEDMLLELTDYQIEYSVTELKYYKDGIKGEDCLRVYIKDNQNRFFGLEDIMDVLLRIKDYLKESDYSIDLGIPNSDDYLDIDNFMKEFSGEELYDINIFIYNTYKEVLFFNIMDKKIEFAKILSSNIDDEDYNVNKETELDLIEYV